MKNIAIILIVAMLAFAGGWLLHAEKQSINTVEGSMVFDSSNKKNRSSDSAEQKQEDHSLFIVDRNDTTNYASKISGRFILKKATCAGFDFINRNSIAWANEMDCWHPDTLRLNWLNNKTFYTRDIVRINEICPPRVWIYEIVFYDGKRLILNDVATGWIDSKTERLEFLKSNDKED